MFWDEIQHLMSWCGGGQILVRGDQELVRGGQGIWRLKFFANCRFAAWLIEFHSKCCFIMIIYLFTDAVQGKPFVVCDHSQRLDSKCGRFSSKTIENSDLSRIRLFAAFVWGGPSMFCDGFSVVVKTHLNWYPHVFFVAKGSSLLRQIYWGEAVIPKNPIILQWNPC